jgi:hypothetical protein
MPLRSVPLDLGNRSDHGSLVDAFYGCVDRTVSDVRKPVFIIDTTTDAVAK